MALDPAVVELLAALPAPDPAARVPTPAEMRAQFAATRTYPADLEPVAEVRDVEVPGAAGPLPARLYRPRGVTGPPPVFVWFHGGGWTVGSFAENEVASRAVANASGAAVLAVDYRLAPEHPFPAAADDCYAVTAGLAERAAELGLDGRRLAVGGESAGGNLATVVALMARDRGAPALRAQVSICPVYSHPGDGYGSYAEFAEGYGMAAAVMWFFFEQYAAGRADLDDAYLLPSRATDLRGLPPALVLTAEYDVLRDEGEEFAARLAGAGVDVQATRYDGQIHGFHGLYHELPAAARSYAQVAAYLADRLA